MTDRRRTVVLLAVSAALAALAASAVAQHVERVNARVGPSIGVVSARRDVPEGTVLTPPSARRYLAVRSVPRRYAPGRAFTRLDQILGFATAVPVRAGTFLSPGELEAGLRAPAPAVGRGERAVDVAVSGASTPASTVGPGSRVDVLVTSEDTGAGGRSGRTFLALEDVEVLAAAPAADRTGDATADGPGDGKAATIVTLRTSPRQAVFLAAAQSFAREVRILARVGGDHGRVGRAAVTARDLAD